MIKNQLLEEELRNAFGCPQRFQLLDFLGVGLGSYFALFAAEILKKNPGNKLAVVAVGLGAIMIFIHSQRFFVSEDRIRRICPNK